MGGWEGVSTHLPGPSKKAAVRTVRFSSWLSARQPLSQMLILSSRHCSGKIHSAALSGLNPNYGCDSSRHLINRSPLWTAGISCHEVKPSQCTTATVTITHSAVLLQHPKGTTLLQAGQTGWHIERCNMISAEADHRCNDDSLQSVLCVRQ